MKHFYLAKNEKSIFVSLINHMDLCHLHMVYHDVKANQARFQLDSPEQKSKLENHISSQERNHSKLWTRASHSESEKCTEAPASFWNVTELFKIWIFLCCTSPQILSVSGKMSRLFGFDDKYECCYCFGDVLACPVHRLVAVDTSACGQHESGRDLVF